MSEPSSINVPKLLLYLAGEMACQHDGLPDLNLTVGILDTKSNREWLSELENAEFITWELGKYHQLYVRFTESGAKEVHNLYHPTPSLCIDLSSFEDPREVRELENTGVRSAELLVSV